MSDDLDIGCWFGLSYSNYLVIPRSMLESMPHEWQVRFVALLDEMHKTLDIDDAPGTYTVLARQGNRFIRDPYRDYRHRPPITKRKVLP